MMMVVVRENYHERKDSRKSEMSKN